MGNKSRPAVYGGEGGEMVGADEYDEATFVRRLEQFDRSSKTAFAAACAERIWPLIERYAAVMVVPAGQVVALRAGLDAVWRSCTGSSEDIASVQVLAESMVPGCRRP
ncbi:DUF416 family protein [Cryobacterium sp. MDB1-18-2]|uniref:DUF416 family protein n=1 Tax=unclassified Cryobacterium TaxID=2649013 RepID=UPI0010690F7B|nr:MULTISPECIES: DUF416 family protein [unclassified Cryobacterium]TFC22115.1 DUF416 family protein [Cryobacterium sp. MDB1-18-2]TFC40688.1 DUF416 family protein [Cryobacterium sp. MDB1-18-1]